MSLTAKIKETFDYLHANAEISWQEVETTKYIEKLLQEAGCETETFSDCTGVIGKYGNFNQGLPVIGIRADIDALWQEVNGTFQANHSCGHDAHMAMVLGVLWKLNQIPNLKEQVAVKFVFQPAEEVGAGALKMVEKNVVEDMDYLFGIHLRPLAETENGKASPVIIHGATGSLDYEIIGDDAHGARPHLNKNAIEVGAEIINMIGNIHIDPRVPHSVKVTRFEAGGKSTNIIPGNATFSIDLRAQTNEMMTRLTDKVKRIIEMVQKLYEIEINETDDYGIAAAKTNDEAIAFAKAAIIKALGEDKLTPSLVTPGGDDFHFYTIKKPALKATMIGLGCGLKPGLHHPQMTFDHDALINGTKILYQTILEINKIEVEV